MIVFVTSIRACSSCTLYLLMYSYCMIDKCWRIANYQFQTFGTRTCTIITREQFSCRQNNDQYNIRRFLCDLEDQRAILPVYRILNTERVIHSLHEVFWNPKRHTDLDRGNNAQTLCLTYNLLLPSNNRNNFEWNFT